MRKETHAEGIGGESAQLVTGEPLLGVGKPIFVGEVGAEEGGIVGIESDQEAHVEEAPQGMSGEGGANAGADIGGGVQFKTDGAGFQFDEQGWILDGGQGVADALGGDGERFPNGFGTGGFWSQGLSPNHTCLLAS